MFKMKKGTNVGLDRNFNNVRVGDTIVAKDGTEYTINNYGVAVDQEHKIKKLSDIKDFEVKKQSELPTAKTTSKKPKTKDINSKVNTLTELTDEILVAELRRRGWNVTCTKKVEKVVYKTVKL